jgi:hypothetical protein
VENTLTEKQNTQSILEYFQSLQPYCRHELGKSLKSKHYYGDGEFGDLKVLQRAEQEYKEKHKEYAGRDQTSTDMPEGLEHGLEGEVYIFPVAHEENGSNKTDVKRSIFSIGLEPSYAPLSAFLDADYMVDISPKSVFVIFPDFTLVVDIDFFGDDDWTFTRADLIEKGVIDASNIDSSSDLVSIDKIRLALNSHGLEKTDGELIAMRKQMYGLAEAVHQTMEDKSKIYE